MGGSGQWTVVSSQERAIVLQHEEIHPSPRPSPTRGEGEFVNYRIPMDDQQASGVTTTDSAAPPRWKPLGRIDRRVAGVLVEKAKTTPEQYPMTVNGLVNGCNQKNNRDPQMQLEESDIMESLDRLKSVGAAIEIQGGGRVPKFRHLLYEWLGVE